MTPPFIFLTGATGHIGFATLRLALAQGYRVRVASRSRKSAERLLSLPRVKPYTDLFDVVEIPDFLADDAFDGVLDGVDYILHIASPMPDDRLAGQEFDVQKLYINPAIQGNLGILKAAAKVPSIKRIVITSSVAILDLNPRPNGQSIGPEDLAPVPRLEDVSMEPWAAYTASKQLAHAAILDFVRQHRLHYDVVSILPSYVQGRNDPVTSTQELRERPSSNITMVNFVLGHQAEESRPAGFVLVDDVAATHLAAMIAPNVQSGECFIAAYPPPTDWAQVEAIVRRRFPREVENGTLPLGGRQASFIAIFDVSKTETKLGIHFHGLDDMVQSLVGQYVELVNQENDGGK